MLTNMVDTDRKYESWIDRLLSEEENSALIETEPVVAFILFTQRTVSYPYIPHKRYTSRTVTNKLHVQCQPQHLTHAASKRTVDRPGLTMNTDQVSDGQKPRVSLLLLLKAHLKAVLFRVQCHTKLHLCV